MVSQSSCEDDYTLLCVRPDGVAPVVELLVGDLGGARLQAKALLREHASCDIVEIWLAGDLLERVGR